MENNKKDWTGNKRSTYVTLGASNHVDFDREENDYYATSPKAARFLVNLEKLSPNIWEPACGENHITNELRKAGYNVRTSDLIDRIGDGSVEVSDFLKTNEQWDGDIVTNPPYKYAQEFVEHSIKTVTEGHKVIMYLKLQFLEGNKRRKMFDKYPPKTIWVTSGRLGCAMNGDFNGEDSIAGAVAYAWFVWEKGFKGDPVIKWFN